MVTDETPAKTQLEVVDPLDVLHKLLVAHTPSGGGRGEPSPAMVLAEAGAAIGTERCCEEVTVEEIVVQTAIV